MDKEIIYDIRQFNQFYTKVLGLFKNQILDTDYSLTEARILFEISERMKCIANNLVQELNIDRSYMSRILRKLEREELIEKLESYSSCLVNQKKNAGINSPTSLNESYNDISITIFVYLEEPLLVNDRYR